MFHFKEMKNLENNFIKVAAIHDLSGLGRCSLSVISPILSVMGLQVCAVPTAILSTHTGGFGDVVLRDLTNYIIPALNHYKSLNENFQCIYSGFLASTGQIDHCLEFFSSFPNALKVVDPVMGDYGRAYKTCTKELSNRMRELVEIADIITPNTTEAAMLLGESLDHIDFSTQEIKSWLVRLSEKGPKTVVITGVSSIDGNRYNVGFDKKNSTFSKVKFEFIPVNYPGTGDIFSSILVGGILKGDSLPIAINRATTFLEYLIKTTYSYGFAPREGVMLEYCLGSLIQNSTFMDYETL